MLENSIWPNVDKFLSDNLLADISMCAQKNVHQTTMDEGLLSQLKETGYFKLAIPTQFGGLGASLAECCAVQKALAAADGGMAVGLNMHLFTIGMMYEHWVRHKDMSWMLMQWVAKNHSLLASAFAEPGLGGSLLRSNTKAKRVAKGYILSGIKVPCSIAKRCDMICLQAHTDEDRDDSLIVALLPASTEGVCPKSGRSLFGMTTSESDVLCLNECFLPETLVLHRTVPGQDNSDVFRASLIWFCLSASAIYLGVVKRALEYTANKMHVLKLPPNHYSRASDPLFQANLGEAFSAYQSCDIACAGLANALSSQSYIEGQYLNQALSIKQQTYHTALQVISQLLDLLGASEYVADGLLMKWFRDLQAVRYHPPTPLSVNKILGQSVLGIKVDFDASVTLVSQERLQEVSL